MLKNIRARAAQAAAFAAMASAAPSVALAQSSDDPFAKAKDQVVKVAQGVESIAYPAAIVAIMVLGFLAWKGQFPWGRAIAIAMSIFVIGIASTIVNYFGGTRSSTAGY
jgi:type IV secretory pathway VirB2 component (pilin)